MTPMTPSKAIKTFTIIAVLAWFSYNQWVGYFLSFTLVISAMQYLETLATGIKSDTVQRVYIDPESKHLPFWMDCILYGLVVYLLTYVQSYFCVAVWLFNWIVDAGWRIKTGK